MVVARTQARRVAVLGVLFAVGLCVVLIGAHVTPSGYRAHAPHAPHSVAPAARAAPTPASATPSPSPTDPTSRAGSAWVSIPLLLCVAAIVLLPIVLGLLRLRPRGRWALRRRAPTPAQPAAEQAAADLARRLADAVDAGFDRLAEGPVADAIIACWLSLHDAAAAAGVAPLPSDTPQEFVSRVLGSARVRPVPLRELANLYREARFSAHPMTGSDRAAARAALQSVRADLLAGAHA